MNPEAPEAPEAPAPPGPRVEFRPVTTGADWEQIQHLRDVIYVRSEHRIGEVDDFEGSFDRYNDHSRWFVAQDVDCVLGTVRVVRDSEVGLPYEAVVGRRARGPGEVVAEVGHLLALPGVASQRVVLGLLAQAFAHCCNDLEATHVVGDVFLDKKSGDTFYRRLGFRPLHGPYRDDRFLAAPLSMILVLRVADVAPILRRVRGTHRELMSYLTRGCRDPEIRQAADEPR